MRENEEKSSVNHDLEDEDRSTHWLRKVTAKVPPQQLRRGLAVGAFLLAVLVIWGSFKWFSPSPVHAGEIKISALEQHEYGVSRETSFLLTCDQAIAANTVREYLKISPAFAYDLKKEAGGKSYKIVPQEKLAANTVYKFAFDPSEKGQENLTWAFQTAGPLRVVSTLPRTETVGVPVNTGIEFIFSQEDFDAGQAGKYFTITPKVEGRFEKHKNTLVFVPQSLKPATLYTVTLKKGMPQQKGQESLAEDHIIRFETAAANQSEPAFAFYLEDNLSEFSTLQTPTFPVTLVNEGAKQPPHIDLYRYPDADSFGAAMKSIAMIPGWCTYSEEQFHQDASKLSRIAGYDAAFKPADKYRYFISLPEPVPAGYYLMEVKAGNQVRQAVFQVSDLAVYRAQGVKKSLLWVNDIVTKSPAAQVQLWVNNKRLAVSGDKQGVVLLDEKSPLSQASYALLKSEGKEMVIPLDNNMDSGYYQDNMIRQSYWKYLYLDRELYLPGDKVHFWGVMTPRGKNTMPDTDLTLELWGGDYYYSEQRAAAPLLSQSLKLQGNTFSGQCALPMLKPGYYYLGIKMGNVTLLSRGFTVETYQKPAYQVTVKPDKAAIFAGETVNFRIQSTFFEGTAVPGLSFNYYMDEKNNKVTTNLQGEAVVPYTGRPGKYGAYNHEYFNVNATLPESGNIGDYNGVLVFPSAVHVRAEAKSSKDSFTLTTRLNRVDLTQVDAGGYVREENYLKGPVAGGKIKGQLYKEVWTRTQTGEFYDFINKTVAPVYDYQFKTELVANFDLVTDQQGVAGYSGTLDEGYAYYVELTSPDENGRLSKARVYMGAFYDDYYSYRYYHLQDPQGKTYRAGDKVALDMMLNSRQLDPQGNPVLFFQGQTDIESYQVKPQSRYEFTFREADIPNTNICGVYFDGSSYQEAGSYAVAFDRQSRELKVTVKPDKKEYRPGETVKLAIQVQDQKQQAVKDAHLNLNLVDEALYRLMDQRVDLLGTLYGDYLTPMLSTWKSHYQPQLSGGAERGGEGGGERKDFRDTVLFTDLITDARGQATAQFKLPDNLTSWRITYHALGDGLQAGSGVQQLPVRLPFFVNLTMNQAYRTGDTPVIILHSYGSQLQPSVPVKYEMVLTDPQGKKTAYQGNSTAFAAFDWQLPALREGQYTVQVTARSGKYEDALLQRFDVKNEFIQRNIVEQKLLKTGLTISGSAQEPTTLVFADYEKNQYLEGLYSLSWFYGSRVEHRLASQEAKKLLQKYFPEENYWRADTAATSSLLHYQQKDGGIAILPYGSSDLTVSARVAASAPDSFDRQALKGYFYRLLDEDESRDKSLIWLGLASLEEPVLLPVKQALEQDSFTPAQRINLSLALLEMGDGAYAAQVYKELLSQYSQDLGNSLRINVGRDQDEIVTATTQMALLAARLNQPEKQRLFDYLLQNPGEEIVNSLERLQILNYNLRYMDAAPVSFTYTLKGKSTHRTLKADETFQLTVLPQDLAGLKFSQINGKVSVMIYYSAPVPAAPGINEDLAIKRAYYVKEKSTFSLSRSDLVRVEINTTAIQKAPGGSYEVIDVLPAGLVYLPRLYEPVINPSEYPDWPTEVNGQRLTFVVGKGQNELVYYARVVSPGKFSAEAPLLQHCQNQKVFIRGSQQEMVIR